MQRTILLAALILSARLSFSQQGSLGQFLADSSMIHSTVSLCIKDADNGETIMEYNPEKSLIPASVMKLITSGVSLELLGPQHVFRTFIGYSGSLNRQTAKLTGDIIIKGGGDPALGSKYFEDHYKDFLNIWVSGIKEAGIRKVSGGVIADDSYFDFFPVPAKWQWEDIGNYYGAGVYGLSVYDNIAEIHLKCSSDSLPVVVSCIVPKEYVYNFENRLFAYGSADEGYAFAAPYSKSGWLTGTVPVNRQDFVLNASISDPPFLVAELLNNKLDSSGIKIQEVPSTVRLTGRNLTDKIVIISETTSPPLSQLIEVLNHESVNLYAETLLKELGKKFRNNGSTAAGTDVVKDFLLNAGIGTGGLFMEDGSGLSPRDCIDSETLTDFLVYMKNHGKYFKEFFNSLPEAGKEGTLKDYFMDPAFEGRMSAKSGSMGRVRCYAGYITTNSGRNVVFSILANNFSGSSQKVIEGIERITRDIILYK
jgi:serine-type D-Ala-D-Ala carboxypeptidase/endopeptidase (penicillin-binding protein 4)